MSLGLLYDFMGRQAAQEGTRRYGVTLRTLPGSELSTSTSASNTQGGPGSNRGSQVEAIHEKATKSAESATLIATYRVSRIDDD
jgi:hypothetical protein